MTKQELIDAVKAKYSSIGGLVENPPDKVKNEDGSETVIREHWAVAAFDDIGDTTVRAWVHFYVDPASGRATWQDREPKPTITPPPLTFTAKLQQYLDAAAVAGTPIKGGAILWSSDAGRVAKLEVITPANALKQAIITADANLNFNPPVILA